MCLIAFAINASARWPLVIASNRDEYYERPALPLAPWHTASGCSITSGRDAWAGGTWLGLTPAGRVAFLTNVRAVPGVSLVVPQRSRGELVTRWLEGAMDAAAFMRQTDASAYGGCNLVLGDWQRGCWTWVTNRNFATESSALASQHMPGSGWYSCALPAGIYGLSNAALDTPWPKTLALKKVLADALQGPYCKPGSAFPEAPLWTALASRVTAAHSNLPATGVPPAFEHALSSAFVDSQERAYGTRCSTLLVASGLRDGHCEVQISEKTYPRSAKNGQLTGSIEESLGDSPGRAVLVSELVEWAAPPPV